ncbi:hypothetical protein BURPS1106B_1176 [Burkholderia pseudomallei 1106b]|uniref:Uncharacterized protein n=4 Tax=Burkholderia pseudomallei TaxID=28450 RepID=A0AAX0UDH1_BURPE|nr:hypothetical protein BURPS1106A_A0810 [Burkholderia pseudomallei 1106a]AUL59944.1 hypothetical protein BHT10_30035 [Burkholderia pseudomallei]EES20950.1 hypothetical protein BURPS1106B_1176 [Burkholderia pseudomallei 1106b]PJO66702.1 hypothetical protein CWD88_08725 [Burkholderia pseudomallei]PPF09263.1 hypothetical protein B9D88_000680 [Burkholderia pseudomallei]
MRRRAGAQARAPRRRDAAIGYAKHPASVGRCCALARVAVRAARAHRREAMSHRLRFARACRFNLQDGYSFRRSEAHRADASARCANARAASSAIVRVRPSRRRNEQAPPPNARHRYVASVRSRCGRLDDRATAFGAARASRPPAARRSHGPHSTMTNPVRAACGAHTLQPTVSSASTRIALTRAGEREGVRTCGRDHRAHAYRTSGKRMNVACVGSGDDLNRRAQRMDRMAALTRCAAQSE